MNTSTAIHYAAETEAGPSSEPVEQLLARVRRSDHATRRELETRCLEQEMPFARRMARPFKGRGISGDDVDQIAYVGLLKALRRFDPARGESFHAYACVVIRGELRRHFRDCGWMVRPPRGLQELQAIVRDADAELTGSLGRTPRLAELAHRVGVPPSRVAEARCLEGCFQPRSLDAPRPGDRSSLGERLATVDEGFEVAEMRAVLSQCQLNLSERDLRIIELRFIRGCTQQEIGDAIGVTQMQVSRLISRILRDLRRAVGTGTTE